VCEGRGRDEKVNLGGGCVLGRQEISLEVVMEGDQMVHGEASIRCLAILILTSPKRGRAGEAKRRNRGGRRRW
jgi:hypothetical protein